MNPYIGFFKPSDYFKSICLKPRQEQADSLIKCIIFTLALITTTVYLVTPLALDTFGYEHTSGLLLLSTLKAFIWVAFFFLFQGLFSSVAGKLFKVEQNVAQVGLCHFWATAYGFVAIVLLVVIFSFLVTFNEKAAEVAQIPLILGSLVVKFWFQYKSLRVSMLTSKLESIAVLGIALVLTVSVKQCFDMGLNSLLN